MTPERPPELQAERARDTVAAEAIAGHRSGRLTRRRYTDEWVGLLVLAAIGVFAAAAIEAGILHNWLQPPGRLHILLPQTGVGGLSPGADVEVFGIHAGTVRHVRLNPDGETWAEAEIDPQAEPFIRRDSAATIKLRYAVAGAAYVSLSRGKGEPMDWHYAVVKATTDPNPVDMITATIADIRTHVLPILDNAQAMTASLKAVAADLQQGRGSAGKLLTDDTLIRQAEATVTKLQDTIAKLQPQIGSVLDHANRTMSNVQSASRDLKAATPQLPAITRNARDATAELPALLLQAQATTHDLQGLITQLRGLWLLGGGGTPKPADHRISPAQVAP
ncbi:phospholipid/cholesterol/gamma-HCH transport system substrate-binding protein [Endobacter medicaginis]|uniref:Phospholipid/cholesterol/gamma-HCH transport system substrate-binding protein n=2 Tax=Endobacter medicaginis TaxID=1181271 RepID=A0A839UV10_9PROT|nr:MlaD family protein [Endobacter medicaginis]MBB3173616.1 phospholipid/cholesterol/gamma-HCH transport system substrate-binding protein [Endobacter medicaginis]MCX5477040.1 MlaD family protein [Endobacter medicaginis]